MECPPPVSTPLLQQHDAPRLYHGTGLEAHQVRPRAQMTRLEAPPVLARRVATLGQTRYRTAQQVVDHHAWCLITSLASAPLRSRFTLSCSVGYLP
ncbi:MAG TPA: hypothetical protein VKP65_15970 [Rhodothermales bacterium]|nr:hypothetical protein [Rhodothermales bacterium]